MIGLIVGMSGNFGVFGNLGELKFVFLNVAVLH